MHPFRQISIFEIAVFAAAIAVGLTIYRFEADSIDTAIVTAVWVIVVCTSARRYWPVLVFHSSTSLLIYHSYFGGDFYSVRNGNDWLLPFAYLDVAFICLTLSSLIVVVQSCILYSTFRPYHAILAMAISLPLFIAEYPIAFSLIIGAIIVVFMRCWPEIPEVDFARTMRCNEAAEPVQLTNTSTPAAR